MRPGQSEGSGFTVRGVARGSVLMVPVVLLLLTACGRATPSVATRLPTATAVSTEPPVTELVTPVPTCTADLSTPEPSATPTPTPPPATPTTVEQPPSATTGAVPAEPPTRAPEATNTPESPTDTLASVTDARVIYHNGFSQDGIAIYERGAFPWLDLLVRLGETWYGPEREPDDGFLAVPLPEGLRWEAEGGFGTLPNGEAWWTESGTTGKARLIDSNGRVLHELPLQITFRGSGGGGENGEPGLRPTPT